MAVYQLNTILTDVKVVLDQNTDSTALGLTGDIDTLSNDEIIRAMVLDAIRRVYQNAPGYLLDSGHTFVDFDTDVYWNGDGSGWVLLPHDFMNLVSFKMSDWSRAVYQAITADMPEYALQRSKVKGVRGNPEKPVVAIALRREGKALEFYSCKDENALVERAVYVPYPKIDTHDGVEVIDRCYQAVVYMTAALVLQSLGEVDRSKVMIETANSALI